LSVVVIHRAHHSRQDRARKYRVLVDGQQRAELGDDETVQIPVTPGPHVVRMKIDWRRSRDLPVDIRHGEIVRLECKPRSSPFLTLLYITIWRNKYISLDTVTP
jgi:hypothetical protein